MIYNPKGLLMRIAQLWRFGHQVLVEGRGSSTTEILSRSPSLIALTTRTGVRSQKLHQNWEEDPNIGFVLVEEGSLSSYTESSPMSDPSYEQCRPCKSVVELGHIVDRGPRATRLKSSSSVHKRCHFNSSIPLNHATTAIQKHPFSKEKVKLFQKLKLEQSSRSFSTTMDKFPMERVLGFHKDPWWRSSVESLRNVAVYGESETDTQKARLREIILNNTDKSSKERSGSIRPASIYCTWKGYNINLVDLPLQDEYSLSRALCVIDGAILVLCAVNGVYDSNVDINMRKNGIARLVFIENLDKVGADPWRVITEVREKLRLRSAALQIPIGLGPKFQGFVDIVECKAHYFHKIGVFEVPNHLQGLVSGKRRELMKLVSKVDERLKMDSSSSLKDAIRRATVAKKFVPVCLGNALQYKSLQFLLDGIFKYLPCPLEVNISAVDHKTYEKKVILSGNPEGSLVGLVFASANCLEYIRLYEGMIEKGSVVRNVLTEEMFQINALFRLCSDGLMEIEHAIAGDIVVTSGAYYLPGDTLTDESVEYTIPCSMSLRPVEIGLFHKLFSSILEDRSKLNFRAGESLHGAAIKTGSELAMRHNLISLYCLNQKYESVREVLLFTEDFNRKLLNSLIHGFAAKAPRQSLVCFRKLLHVGPPTDVTYRGLIRAYRRVEMTASQRLHLVKSIFLSMKAYGVTVERRHRLAMVDMLLGGGLMDAAFERMEEDKISFDEKLITSFLHAYTPTRDYTNRKETEETETDLKMIKEAEKRREKCQIFVDEMEKRGFEYSINRDLKLRLKEAGVKTGLNVSTSDGGQENRFDFVEE